MWSRVRIVALVAIAAASQLPNTAEAEPGPSAPQSSVLFSNVRIFDGKSATLSRAVQRAGARQHDREDLDRARSRPTTRRVIDGGGRTLMPGLIDAHWHAMLVRPTPSRRSDGDVGYINLLAGAEATATLMRGFTTVRDMGGPAFGLKRAIDEGLVAGPAHLSLRRDDHDHRRSRRLPPAVRVAADDRRRCSRMSSRSAAAWSPTARTRFALRAREQLMQGATQIKLTAGGGVASPFSPLDVSTFTEPSCAPRSRRPRTGAPMSPSMPTRRRRSSGRSPPASSASSTAI